MNRAVRLGQWARGAFWAGAGQSAVQLSGFIAGIIVIRYLPPAQYAYYTVAVSALGVMTVLTDGGIANGVLAQGGQVWQQRSRLGAVIAAGMALRRRLGALAVAVSLPLILALLRHQGADWPQAVLVAISILPFFITTLTGQLLEVVPRLQQQLRPLQITQTLSNLARIAVVAVLLPHWPLAAVALLATALPQCWANLRLRRLADRYADWRTQRDQNVSRQLSAQVRRTLPGAIYYAVSGQLSIWLITIFGPSDAVAAVGALGRLAMALSAVAGIFSLVAVPRFARIPDADPELVRRRFLQTQVLFVAVSAMPVAALAAFPGPVLAVLGPHYGGLGTEALLMALSYVATMLCGLAYVLGASRGVVVSPWLSIPYCIAGQVILILLLPLHQVAGVIWIGLLSEASLWLLHAGYFLQRSAAALRAAPPGAGSPLAT